MPLVTLILKLPVAIKKRRKWYLASCPVFDVHSQGETREKAKENLIEALELFLVSCIERETLDKVLKDCGFEAAYEKPRESVDEDNNMVAVPIPFRITGKPNTHHACHA